ncbi:MAG: epoxyqueuosine reductase [Oscillospiraceae bacterium]|nr:epoxyqueuosine reductase [Oscillospiraceae bacterium]
MKKVLENCNLADFSFVSFQHLNILNVRSKQRIPQNAKTAIAIIFPYYNKSAFCGNVSAYCAVADYHTVVMEQLKSIIDALQHKYPANSFVPFVDSSPVDEVDMAVKGGLGVKGENSLLITERWGSFVFIGEIITDLEWDTELHSYTYCMGCGLCAKKCPGGAIGRNCGAADTKEICDKQKTDGTAENCGGYSSINRENCASFISQKKQELTEEQRTVLEKAGTVFGCDICQKVCPHNKSLLDGTSPAARETNLFSGDIFNTVTKENVEGVYRDRPFGFRGLKVLERNLEIYNSRGR